MIIAASKRLKQSVYPAILVGLLIGLLFSNSEGVHLLPFPVSDNGGGSKNSQAFSGKNSSLYNPATLHSLNNFLKLNTKNQKTIKLLSVEKFEIFRLDVIKNFNQGLDKTGGTSQKSYTSVHLLSLSDRAPPIV